MTSTRRDFLRQTAGAGAGWALGLTALAGRGEPTKRPNILLAISDDQSWRHTSMEGYPAVQTPAFDRVAREGVWFRNAFCASPGCSPSRASLLTGRHCWMNEHAGTHASEFPAHYTVYPDLLEEAGYVVGYTGKGWGPGNFQVSGRKRNPAGPAFQSRKNQPPYKGISNNDYAANFSDFLSQRPEGKPFCFWYGATEPHRGYEDGAGLKEGKKLEDATPPKFLPDCETVRSDILDYCVEIEWFDKHLQRIMDELEKAGELDNTLIVVTGDNGMPFPRAKANCYEYGIHAPLAIRWPSRVRGGRVVEDLVGFVDLAPTFLEAAGLHGDKTPRLPHPMIGRSLMNILTSEKSGRVDPTRDAVYASRERHSSSRWDNGTYPQRALRTERFLYIFNFKPDRWPAGAPRQLRGEGSLTPMHSAYTDIDNCPSKSILTDHPEDPFLRGYLDLAVQRRPMEELFDIHRDPDCLYNLASDPDYADALRDHRERLMACLKETGDPRVHGNGDVWETYKRYSPLRQFPKPDWAE